ncbi:ankyrin repeat domain-containing protein [Legionella sp. D16C41]|uniref:ankyrin repeat domain-containing protein n=1 Tax=Legionella sp. D16C41 TaxID=3402688 RepID=UPI003AF8681B
MTKVTHQDLIILGKTLGYNNINKGVCRGFSCMWAQAVLAGDEASFFNRLELIESYHRNFDQLKRDIDQVKAQVKARAVLGERAKALLQILAFFDGIALYLTPPNYRDLFSGRYVSQLNLTTIYPTTQPEQLKQAELEVLLNKPFVFKSYELALYLIEIDNLLSQAPLRYPILLGNNNHSVCLTYDKETDMWDYLDTNDFARYPSHPHYIRKLSCAETVASIFNSLDGDSHVALEITLLTASNRKSVTLKEELAKLDKQYDVISPELAIRYNKWGTGLLHLACYGGHQTMVQTLLQYPETAVNQKERKNGTTPLYRACQNGHQEIVDILLKYGQIAVNQADNNGVTSLYGACFHGHKGTVEILLKHQQIAVNQADNKGSTPLHVACQNGHQETVEILLKHQQIAVNQANNKGVTPLHVACQNGHQGTVEILLKHQQIAVNQADNDGSTPLHSACQNGHQGIIEILLKHQQIAVNQATNKGVTPLHIACLHGHQGTVDILLKHQQIAVNQADNKGITPLYSACENGHQGMVDVLLKHQQIAVNQATNTGVTPLHIACENGHEETVDILLKHQQIAVNQVDNDGSTPLHVACENGHEETVEILLKHQQIAVNQADNDGSTPLHIACIIGIKETVEILLGHQQIAVNQADNNGATPLHIACENGYQETVDVLLKHQQIAVNQADNNGATPLHIACHNGRDTIVDLLVNREEIVVDAIRFHGYTPLQVACLSPHTHDKPTIFQSLLNKHASLTHQNEFGQCALDIALAQNNAAAITTLLTFIYNQTLNVDYLMSKASLKRAIEWSRQTLPDVHHYLVQSQFKQQNTAEGNLKKHKVSQESIFSVKKNKLNSPLEHLEPPRLLRF